MDKMDKEELLEAYYKSVESVTQYTIDKEKLEKHLESSTPKHTREQIEDSVKYVQNLRKLCDNGGWYTQSYTDVRAKSCGWYTFNGEGLDYHGFIRLFRLYRNYKGWYIFFADHKNMFNIRQTFEIGDVIKKQNVYHEITGIYYSDNYIRRHRGKSPKRLIFQVKSLVTGSISYVGFTKMPKMKKYELSDKQKANLQKKREEMEDLIKEAKSSTSIKLLPRKRLGLQNKYATSMVAE